MALCPNCGRRIQFGTDFCPYCNEEITEDENDYRRDRRNYSSSRKRRGRDNEEENTKTSYNNDINRSRNTAKSRSERPIGSYERVKRLNEENNKLRKKLGLSIIINIGMVILLVIVFMGFVTSAMNVSSLTLKAKNSEEKLNSIMDDYKRLKKENGEYFDADDEKNPFKDDIEAAGHTTTQINNVKKDYKEEDSETVTEKSETTTEEYTETTTQKKEVKNETTTSAPVRTVAEPVTEKVTEKIIEKPVEDPVTPQDEPENNNDNTGENDDGIESYLPIIPD